MNPDKEKLKNSKNPKTQIMDKAEGTHKSGSNLQTQIISSNKNSPSKFGVRTYKKRGGTIDKGKEYEWLVCALYALKFSTNEEVEDFDMTTNNEEYGQFDDIIINVTFKNHEKVTFLFQLKHRERTVVSQQMLTQKEFKGSGRFYKSRFYLPDMVESTLSSQSNQFFILYTNSDVEPKDNKLSFKDESYRLNVEEHVSLKYDTLLKNNHSREKILHFRPEFNKTLDKQKTQDLQSFYKNFYVFAGQDNFEEAEVNIKNMLQAIVGSDIYEGFEKSMKTWWSKNFVLTKRDFITKLTELVLSPYILPLSGSNHNEKTELLEEAIMRFDITIMDNSADNVINNIWRQVEKEKQDWDSSVLRNFESVHGEMSQIQKSKFLWDLGKVPLVVKVDASNEAVLVNIVNFLRTYGEKKSMILLGKIPKEEIVEWNVFENLYNLTKKCGEEKFYIDILRKFTLSLQGKPAISLNNFIDLDPEFPKILEVNKLLEMTQVPHLIIGNQQKIVSDFYITRSVSPIFINTKEILKYRKRMGDVLLIFNCDSNFKEKIKNQNLKILEANQYLHGEYIEVLEGLIILSSCQKCDSLQFEQICNKSEMSQVFLFQVVDEDSILLLSKGQLPGCFNIKKDMQETEIFRYFDNSLNVICGPSGIGKSSLLAKLFQNCPKSYWTIHIHLKDYRKFLTDTDNLEGIFSHFLKLNELDDFSTKLIKMLWMNKKVQIFFDELNELDTNSKNVVIKFAKFVSIEGANVWISAQESLVQELKVVPIKLQPLPEEEQIFFLREKLKVKFNFQEIERIVSVLFKSVNIFNCRELLGLPLHLEFIVKMFLNLDETYKTVEEQNIFLLTKFYKYFFEEKKNSTIERMRINTELELQFNVNYEFVLQLYEIPALKSCLGTAYQKLHIDESEAIKFLNQIRNNGDKMGIIRSVTNNNVAVFHHQTYAEYFACQWLVKNLDKVKLLKQEFFLEKFQNLRLMFDVLLAENSPLHLAIIYKDVDLFEKHLKDVDKRDKADRNPLHLACSYGMEYPTTINPSINQESESYKKIMDVLTKNITEDQWDTIFGFNYADYSLHSSCLLSIEKLIERKLYSFENTESYSKETLVFYAAQFGYHNLLSELIKNEPEIVNKLICYEYNLLLTAVRGINGPRYENRSTVELLLSKGININQVVDYSDCSTVLDFTCKLGYYDMLEFLLSKGAKCSGGNTILHVSAKYGTINDDVIPISNRFNIDFNTKNKDGKTALHYLCQNNNKVFTKKLLEMGADINVVDYNNNNALLHADQSEVNADIIHLLLDNNIDVNVQNKEGRTALHYATENCHFDVMTKLIEKGADPKILDAEGNNALHHLCNTGIEQLEIVDLLIKKGINVNDQNQYGTTPLHLACKYCLFETANILIQNGGNTNLKDNQKNNSLHYVYQSQVVNVNIINLLITSGIHMSEKNVNGLCGLHILSEINNAEILRKLPITEIDVVDDEGNNSLHYALRAKDVNSSVIDFLLNNGIDVNFQNKDGMTALHLACYYGHFKISEKLILNGAKLDVVDFKDFNNPLHYAAQSLNGNVELVQLLINKEIDINSKNKYGATAFQLACASGNVEIVKEFIAKKFVDTQDNYGNTALHYALTSKNKDIINLLIDLNFDVNAKNNFGTTPYQYACQNGYFEITNKIISKGVDINCVDNNGNNALHYALQTEQFSPDVVNLLIEKSLNVEARNNFGTTPLHLAAEKGLTSVVKKLMKRGVDINATDEEKNNTLHYLLKSNNPSEKIFDLLFAGGIKINVKNKNGATPLHLCCENGNVEIARKLLENGAKVNLLDREKNTALYYAVKAENVNLEVIDLLLTNKINVDAKNQDGLTALHLCCKMGLTRIARRLIRNKADVNILDLSKNNALHCAAKSENVDLNLINLLINTDLNLQATNEDGKTPLQFAKEAGLIKVEEMLMKSSISMVEKQPKIEKPKTLHTDVVKQNFRTYSKKQGIVDKGQEYEYLTCALLALRFSIDDRVFDFNMTSHNMNCGDFDDIELEVTYKNHEKITYLFQLKHRETGRSITKEMLTETIIKRKQKLEKNDFYLPTYIKSAEDLKRKEENVKFILSTNDTVAIESGERLSFQSFNPLDIVTCCNLEYSDLLLNEESEEKSVFQLLPVTDNTEIDKNVYKNFYFFYGVRSAWRP